MVNPVGLHPPFLLPVQQGLYQRLVTALQMREVSIIDQLLKDLNAQQLTPKQLGHIFIICIQQRFDQFYMHIFNFPHAQQIPSNGQWGLGHALIETVKNQDPDSLGIIRHHINFNSIDAQGNWGLAAALQTCIDTLLQERSRGGPFQGPPDPNPAYLNAIIEHPHANQIPFNNIISRRIGVLLLVVTVQSEKRFNAHDSGIIEALFNPHITHLIQINGEFGLGRVLVNAAYTTTPFIVNAILNRPQTHLINSNPTQVIHETEVERIWEIRCFGISEAIFAAANNGDPAIQQVVQAQFQIIQALSYFAMHGGINLNVNGPFGLVDSLTSAEENCEQLVPIILQILAGATIVPHAIDEEHGGLSKPLINAAR